MKKITLIHIVSFLLICNFSLLGEGKKIDQAAGKVTFSSSNPDLNRLFEWAKNQALAYAFPDDPVGFWYESALPGREAFCMRDVSHQSIGAHILGLEKHTKNMLRKFAENISESKDWCSYWEIDRYGNPPYVDYYDEAAFWYNLPANFDVLDCCYRMYLWTGDRTYIDDPAFLNFYKRTVYDYVDRWDLSLDKIMKRPRIMNIKSKEGPKNRFQRARGIPGYDEGDPGFVVALDLIVVMQAGYNAYARMIKIHGDNEEAEKFHKRAQEVKSFIDSVWWDDKNQHYYTNLSKDYELEYFGPDRSIPYWDGTDDESKMRAVIDEFVAKMADTPDDRVEGLSHLAEILYRYGEHKTAYDLLMRLMTSSRREYPEVSYTTVASLVNGLMGIELEVFPPEMALTWGGYVDRYITTLPRLTDKTQWGELKNLQIRKNDITVRHEGLRKTILTNNCGPSFLWKAKFPGSYKTLLVNGQPVRATQEKLFAVDQQITWIRATVGAGETIEVEVK
jgi:hypothetical protein